MKQSDAGLTCHEALERLWAFVDGELDDVSAADVRTHFEVCVRCYPLYDFQRAYFRLLRRIAAKPEAPAVRDRVLARLLAEAGRDTA